MANKTVITKEQAKAIEGLREIGSSDERILSVVADPNNSWLGDYKSVNDMEVLTLASALINGYEVEQTPEEKVRGVYEMAKKTEGQMHTEKFKSKWQGVQQGVEYTLGALGIKIEGVNE
jgi:hypothetical protein